MKKIAWCLLVVFFLGMLTSCSAYNKENSESGEMTKPTHTEDNTTVNTIQTEYFTMKVPESWDGLFNCYHIDSNDPDDLDMNVNMISKNEFSEAHLFTLSIQPIEDTEDIELDLEIGVEPIAVISKDGIDTYFLGYILASEMACTEDEEEKFLQMIEEVPQVIQLISATTEYELRLWEESMREEILSKEDEVPYVPISVPVLDASLQGYKNQTGGVFVRLGEENVYHYYIKTSDTMDYYLVDEIIVGVENEKIDLLTCYASKLTGKQSSSTIRDVINAMEMPKLFEVAPAVMEVNNGHNSKWLFYWKIENGYIGFVAINGNVPSACYSYAMLNVVLFKDLSVINSVSK